MKIIRMSMLVLVAWTAVAAAADRSIAMRAEVAPVAGGDDGVVTEVVVRVAPEDRGVLGRDVMVWAELSSADRRVFRRGWALKFDDPSEPLRIEAIWPPGQYLLKIELRAAADRAVGVWWGEVEIAAPEAGSEAESESESEPESESVPESETESEFEPETESSAEPVPVSDGSGSEQGQETAAAAGWTAAAEPGTESEPEAESESESESEPVSEPESGPGAEPGPAPDRSATAAETESVRPAPALLAPELAGWSELEAGPGEVTVSVARRDEAGAEQLERGLEVRVDGDPVAITATGGADRAPLMLGVVVDLARESSADTGWVGQMLAALADPARDGRGVVTLHGVGAASVVDPVDVPELVADGRRDRGTSLPAVIAEALDAAAASRGRVFLVVATDGRETADRDEWRRAADAARRSGVPLLIAGVWNADFRSGVRRSLRALAEASGGTLFLVQGSSQGPDLVDRFRAVLDSSLAIRVAAEPGDDDVKVSRSGRGDEIIASTSIR
jgi:hypothetical protein